MEDSRRHVTNTPYHHGNLRTVLIRVGREMLETNGLMGFSLRALARQANVSHAAPVHHFKSVASLLASCKADGFYELASALEQARDAAATGPNETLCTMSTAYLDFATANPVLLRLMFDKDSAPSNHPHLKGQSHRAYTILEDAVRATMPETGTDLAAFDLRVNAVWSLIHGFSILHNEEQLCRRSADPAPTSQMLASSLMILLQAN